MRAALNARTTFPSVLCAPSRKNILSQGLTLIQVRSFQLPALGPSCKCCGEFFAVHLQNNRFPRRRRTPCIETVAPCTDAHASDAKGLQVHEDRGCCFCIFVAKRRAAEAPVRGRWREGARKKAKSFVLPLPPIKAKGKCLRRREVRTPHRASRAKLPTCNQCCTARRVHRCSSATARAFQSYTVNKGQLHFLLLIFPFTQFLVRRCCARSLALAGMVSTGRI